MIKIFFLFGTYNILTSMNYLLPLYNHRDCLRPRDFNHRTRLNFSAKREGQNLLVLTFPTKRWENKCELHFREIVCVLNFRAKRGENFIRVPNFGAKRGDKCFVYSICALNLEKKESGSGLIGGGAVGWQQEPDEIIWLHREGGGAKAQARCLAPHY